MAVSCTGTRHWWAMSETFNSQEQIDTCRSCRHGRSRRWAARSLDGGAPTALGGGSRPGRTPERERAISLGAYPVLPSEASALWTPPIYNLTTPACSPDSPELPPTCRCELLRSDPAFGKRALPTAFRSFRTLYLAYGQAQNFADRRRRLWQALCLRRPARLVVFSSITRIRVPALLLIVPSHQFSI